MNARCQDLREWTLSLEEGGLCVPDELRAHLRGCGECATWFARRAPGVAIVLGLERLRAPDELERRVAQALTPQAREQRIVETLSGLPRHEAPFELDGRVVAAAHAGHREDRAIAWLRDGLTPRRAPAHLERRVVAELNRDAAGGAVPAELEARLDRDLRDLEGTIAERYASRLEPLPAPEMLRARVHETLQRVGRQRRMALAALGLLAVSALALSGWRLAQGRTATEPPAFVVLQRPELEFTVVAGQPGSFDFSPLMKALAGAVTSGLSEELLAAPAGSGSIPDDWIAVSHGVWGAPDTHGASGRPSTRQTAGAHGGDSPNQPSSSGGFPAELADLRSQPFLEKLDDAPFQVPHAGERRVVVRDPQSGATLELLEGVWSDGKGNFSVQLLDGGPADELFGLMHNGREGFIQRYRDFRVRDLARFLENFEVDVLDVDSKVAGLRVIELEVARYTEPGSRYRVAIEPSTGLVLRYEERHGTKGELVARVEYESIDLEPDLDQIELTGGPSGWLEFDPDEVPPEIAEHLFRPAYVPRHHHLERAASRKGPFGRSWVEFVYGDGVEQVFFLHADLRPEDPPPGPTGLERGDFVRVARVGAWTILEGEIRGVPVAALGKLDLDEILLLVQSAFGD